MKRSVDQVCGWKDTPKTTSPPLVGFKCEQLVEQASTLPTELPELQPSYHFSEMVLMIAQVE